MDNFQRMKNATPEWDSNPLLPGLEGETSHSYTQTDNVYVVVYVTF